MQLCSRNDTTRKKGRGVQTQKSCYGSTLWRTLATAGALNRASSYFSLVFSSREALSLCLLGSAERLTNVGAAELDLEDTLHLAEDCRIGLGLHVLVCVLVCVGGWVGGRRRCVAGGKRKQ